MDLQGRKRGRRNYGPSRRNRRRRNNYNPYNNNGNGNRRRRFRPLRFIGGGVKRVAKKLFPRVEDWVGNWTMDPGPSNLKGVAINKNVGTKMFAPLNNGGDNTTLTHSELIATVDCQDVFQTEEKLIQPGFRTFAPWLANTAKAYDMYKVNMITFRYVSSCPTTATGKFYMYFDRDVLDKPVSNEVGATQMDGCVSSPLWDNVQLPVNLDSVKPLYTRTGVLPQGTVGDYKTYDLGKLVWIASGPTVIVGAGQLWVDYNITFTRPQAPVKDETSELNPETPSRAAIFGPEDDNPDIIGLIPFKYNDDSEVVFTSFFSGTILIRLTGTTFTDFTVTLGDTYGSELLGSNLYINAAATSAILILRVKIQPKEIATFVASAASVTDCSVLLCEREVDDVEQSEF